MNIEDIEKGFDKLEARKIEIHKKQTELEEELTIVDNNLHKLYELKSLLNVVSRDEQLMNIIKPEEPLVEVTLTGKRKKSSSKDIEDVQKLIIERLRAVKEMRSSILFDEFEPRVSKASIYRILRELKVNGKITTSSPTGAKKLTHNSIITWVPISNSMKPLKTKDHEPKH